MSTDKNTYTKKLETLKMRISNSVPGPGIEPGWVAPPVFETGASTDSAIRANGDTKLSVFFRKSKRLFRDGAFCARSTLLWQLKMC